MTEQTEHRKTMRRRDTGSLRFVTFSCNGRLPLLRNDRVKDAFVTELAACQKRSGLYISAWFVIPEHVHALCWPGPRGLPLAPALSGLKSNHGRTIIRRWRELRAPILDRITQDGRPVYWMPGGGFDRNLYTRRSILGAIEYIHMNPISRGLVMRPIDYPWSSARAWAGDQSGPVEITSPWGDVMKGP